jgi:uncharacterized protein (DUF1015 family)
MVASAAMALLKPFRALRYEARAAGPLDDLVAPPHDVVTPELHERLLARSPYNAIRLVHPDDVAEAARTLAAWRERGVLVRERTPAVWILEDEFDGPDGRRRTRRGLVARVRLEPYSAGVVVPHEQTFPRPKGRRLSLLRAVRTKLSPIFLLHEGPGPEPAGEPALAATLAGVRSRLWAVDDSAEIERALGAVRGRLLIADGHHRYEAALRFHEEEPSDETAYVLAVLVGRADPGLTILPTHRMTGGPLPDLDGRFRSTAVADAGAGVAALARARRDRPAFVVVRRDGAVLLEGDGPAPDTAAVDALPLADVSFTASAEEATRAVAAGAATAAFLVRPPTIEQVEAFALAGERMPPKTTYFFPKLTSGLLFSPLDE